MCEANHADGIELVWPWPESNIEDDMIVCDDESMMEPDLDYVCE